MKLLVLSHQQVEELLTMRECIRVMEEALADLARGKVANPLRTMVRAEGAAGFLGLMPSYRGDFGLKEICVFPENPKRGLDTHLGAVILHDGETGAPKAIINASAITAIRTAAVSGVATKLLAREDSRVLAILGAGVQAKSHFEAIPLVRDIRETRVYSHSPVKGFKGCRIVSSAEEAVTGADIVVTATSSKEPVIRREWIKSGAHINAVGSSVKTSREIDSATMAAASLFVDRRESTVNESGDYLMALAEGAIKPNHIRAELGEILIGKARGRTSADEITLFKSLGLAVEDLASAQFLFGEAQRRGTGTWVEF